jgi:DNA mismatch endonuclease (patch repair protein)
MVGHLIEYSTKVAGFGKEQQAYCLSCIRGKDTKPEMVVRSLIHRLGYRYRLHQRNLPGQPDIVLARHRKIIFVHGCFWHMHKCRYGKVIPQTRKKFWQTKRQATVARDRKTIKELKTLGWKVLVLWECQIRNTPKLSNRIKKFLSS